MNDTQVYRQLAQRTDGDIYIGVVGPVRTGKSTFIKQYVELVLMPAIRDEAVKARTRDELPQSAAGKTIMTTEPKFVPETAVTVELEGGGSYRARLVDCVGYMVAGALGHREENQPRMVKSPWFDHEIPFDLAAETGTEKVIREHSTIGVVVTTDGSISDIPREGYVAAEQRVIRELKEAGKPFLILLNCLHPNLPQVQALADEMAEQYDHPVIPVNCLNLDREQLDQIMKSVLLEFPIRQVDVELPRWVTELEADHWLQKQVYDAILKESDRLVTMEDAGFFAAMPECPAIEEMKVTGMTLGEGTVSVKVTLEPDLFYQVLSELTGLEIKGEEELLPCVMELAKAQKAYRRVKDALDQVDATGYGIVMPSMEELQLEQPEVIRQGGRYGIRLAASAPSIHLLRADIHTEISPIVGTEKQSEDLIRGLMDDFENDPLKLWQSNLFGKSLHELVNDGLQGKLLNMPQEARARMQETLEQVINEGCSGLICILL